MPNWCSNTLEVRGDTGELQKFIEAVSTKDENGEVTYDFTLAFPMPEILQGTRSPSIKRETFEAWKADKDHFGHTTEGWFEEQEALVIAGEEAMKATGFDNWYEWAWQNWGTKWSPDIGVCHIFDENRVIFNYETAWSPAQELIREVSELFPTLDFIESYDESGMGFLGASSYKEGHQLVDIYKDFDDIPKYNELSERLTKAENDDNHEVADACYEEFNELVEDYKETLIKSCEEMLEKV